MRLSDAMKAQQHLLDAIPNLVWLEDLSGEYAAINKRFADWCEVPLTTFGDLNHSCCWDKETAERLMQASQSVKESKAPVVFELFSKNSWFEITISPVFDKSDLIGVVGIALDITQRKTEEESLKTLTFEKERELLKYKSLVETLFSATPDLIAIQDLDHRILMSNWKGELEYVPQNKRHSGIKCYSAIYGLEEPCPRCRVYDVVETKEPLFAEIYNKKNNRYQLVHSFPIFGKTGDVKYVVKHIRDITHRKASESLLKESEDRYKSFFNNTTVGVGIFNVDGTVVKVNNKLLSLLEFSDPSEIEGKPFECIFSSACIDPQVAERYKKLVDGSSSGFEIEICCETQRKKRVWFKVWAAPFDLFEKSSRLIGAVFIDVTFQKEAEEKLEWEKQIVDALEEIYEPLMNSSSIQEITNIILKQALSLTKSKYGFVSEIDPITKYNVGHSLSEMTRGECSVERDSIYFSIGSDGKYPGLWGHVLNTKTGFYTNDTMTFPEFSLPVGHFPITRFLSVPVLLREDLLGQIALAESTRDYTQQDVTAVQRLADYYTIALVSQKAKEALTESEGKYKALINIMVEGLVVQDENWSITFVNDAFCNMLGYARSELLGRKFVHFVKDESLDVFLEAKQQRSEGKIGSYEIKIVKKNKETRSLFVSGVPILDKKNVVRGSLGVCSDITERLNTQKALLQSERLKAVGEMAAGVAHNFNNLLQVIVTRSQMAMRKIDKAKHAESRVEIGHVLSAALSGAEIVKRIQDFSRPKLDETDKDLERFDLSVVVRQAVEMCKPLWGPELEIEGNNISLETNLQNECFVYGKQVEILEVIVNLIKNAVEALKGNGSVWVETSKKAHDIVMLMVKDTGVGIEEENLSKIFEPFWTTKGSKGNGMGLTSSYGIVQSHGGSFKVYSQLKKGSTFLVGFPLAPIPNEPSVCDVSGMFKATLKVVLIDDTQAVLDTMQTALLTYGHEVQSFSSPKEALQNLDWNADVVVCDLGMPDMNGWEVGKKIKELSKIHKDKKMPFILMTGWGNPKAFDLDKLFESGVDLVLEKPLTLDVFMTSLGKLLGLIN
jgi:PAS domain S-box-containing protein